MGDWGKIDALRERVAGTDIIEIDPGPFKTLRDAWEALSKLGARARVGFIPDRLITSGWEIFLSRRRQGSAVYWHLSARLHPHGRLATKNDWEMVGKIAGRIGAPHSPVLVPMDPRAAVHWSWTAGR
jgi:hypothetical protein